MAFLAAYGETMETHMIAEVLDVLVQLAANADLYVNDAFGCAHRAHASTAGVTNFLKPAVAGLLMKKVAARFIAACPRMHGVAGRVPLCCRHGAEACEGLPICSVDPHVVQWHCLGLHAG